MLEALYGSSTPKKQPEGSERSRGEGLAGQLGFGGEKKNTGSVAEQFGMTPSKDTVSLGKQLGAEVNKNTVGLTQSVNVTESLEKPQDQTDPKLQRQHSQTYGESVTQVGRMTSLEAPQTGEGETEERQKAMQEKQETPEQRKIRMEREQQEKDEEEKRKKQKAEEEIKAANKAPKHEKNPGAG